MIELRLKLNWTVPEFFNSNVLPSNNWCKNDQCNAQNQNHSKLRRISSQIITTHVISTLYRYNIEYGINMVSIEMKYFIALKVFLNFHQSFAWSFCIVWIISWWRVIIRVFSNSNSFQRFPWFWFFFASKNAENQPELV